LSNKHVEHINSTFYGGGVAEILNSLTLLMNDVGITTGWRLLKGNPGFFNITKGFHNALQGASLAVDELNSKEGIKGRRINLIVEDDQCDPKIAVSAIEKLINVDKVAVIIGPSCSSSVLAAAPIAEKTRTISMTTIASSPKITYAGDYIFRK